MHVDFYLLAFDSRLRGSYTTRELFSLSETMAERGIRIRRSLEEVLDERGTRPEGVDVDSVDEDNELEHESRERRRLMPY